MTVSRPYAGTRTDLHEVLALAERGALAVPVETFPLADVEEAVRRLGAGEIAGRAVLVPN